MSDPGRTAELLFHIDRRIGIGSGAMPPSLLAWAEPRGIGAGADLQAAAVGYTGVWAGGDDGTGKAILSFSQTGGRTWRDVTERLPSDTEPITAIAANPGSPYLYVGTAGGSVYKSTDNGQTWATTGAGFTGRVRAFAFCHPDQVWAAADGPALKCTDHSTWSSRTAQLNWPSGSIIYALAQKPQNKDGLMVAGTYPYTPVGKLSYTDNGSTFLDRSSLIPSAIEYHALGYSQLDDRFLVAGNDGSHTRIYRTTDNGATGEEVPGTADGGGNSIAILHCILDTWAVIKTNGAILRITQARSGLVRLADEVSEIVGVQRTYANAKALAYDPTLNRYFLCGDGYLIYTDDVAQVGAFLTRSLPQGNAVVGQVYIAPCQHLAIHAGGGTLVKTGPGQLVGFLITSVNNNAHDVHFYDGTSTGGTPIAVVRVNPSTYGPNPISVWPAHPIQFQNGLYVYSGHGNTRILVAYL